MASSRFLRSQFRVSGFVSDGRVNGAWVVEWKVVETGPKSPKKRLFIAIFWSIPTLASSEYFLGKLDGLRTASQGGVTEAAEPDGEDHFPQPYFSLVRCWSARSAPSTRSRNQPSGSLGGGSQ